MPLPFAPSASSRDHLPRVFARNGDDPYVKPPHRAEHGMPSSYMSGGDGKHFKVQNVLGQIMILLKPEVFTVPP